MKNIWGLWCDNNNNLIWKSQLRRVCAKVSELWHHCEGQMFFSYPFMCIFYESMEDAIYLSHIKIAKMMAFYLKKSLYVPDNYRLVSLVVKSEQNIWENILKGHHTSLSSMYYFICSCTDLGKKHATALALICLSNKIRIISDGKQ